MRLLHAVVFAAAAAALQGCCINDCIGIIDIAGTVYEECASCVVVAPPDLTPRRLTPQAEVPALPTESAVAGSQPY